jgi:hypothetical protein
MATIADPEVAGQKPEDEDQTSCGAKCNGYVASVQAFPGKASYFCYHVDEDEITWCCSLTPLNWAQLSVFLGLLWLFCAGFWALMFFAVEAWPMESLWAFFISATLFFLLFAALIAMQLQEERSSAGDGMACTQKKLKEHIQPQLEKGMKWDEFGNKWHIVHKMPIHEDNPSSDVKDRIIAVCNLLHYTNTMPVFTKDLQKGTLIANVKPREYSTKREAKSDEQVTVTVQQ